MTDRPGDKAADPPIPKTVDEYFAQEAAKLPQAPPPEPDAADAARKSVSGSDPLTAETFRRGRIEVEVRRLTGPPLPFWRGLINRYAYLRRVADRSQARFEVRVNRCPVCDGFLPRMTMAPTEYRTGLDCPHCAARLKRRNPLGPKGYYAAFGAAALSYILLILLAPGAPFEVEVTVAILAATAAIVVGKRLERVVRRD